MLADRISRRRCAVSATLIGSGVAALTLASVPSGLAATCVAVKAVSVTRPKRVTEPTGPLAYTGVAGVHLALVIGALLLLTGGLFLILSRARGRGLTPGLAAGIGLMIVLGGAVIGAHGASAAPAAASCTKPGTKAPGTTTPGTTPGTGTTPTSGGGTTTTTPGAGTPPATTPPTDSTPPGTTPPTGTNPPAANPPAALPDFPTPALALVVGLGGGLVVLRRRRRTLAA